MHIKVICSWCGQSLGFKEIENDSFLGVEAPVTHSICKECQKKALAEIQSISIQQIEPNS